MDTEEQKRIWKRFMQDGTLDSRLPPKYQKYLFHIF